MPVLANQVPTLDRSQADRYHRKNASFTMSRNGKFITFEGVEGCGKSTHIERLAARLSREGHTVLVTREPGGTDIGEQIRDVLQYSKKSAAMKPETELLLFCASRAQLVRETIAPALGRG